MPDESEGTYASALHKDVIRKFDKLRVKRALSREEAMAKAGHVRQAWDKWVEKGASPQLHTLERLANALDAELLVDVRGKEERPTQQAGGASSVHAIEAGWVVDTVPSEVRLHIVQVLHKLAEIRDVKQLEEVLAALDRIASAAASRPPSRTPPPPSSPGRSRTKG